MLTISFVIVFIHLY